MATRQSKGAVTVLTSSTKIVDANTYRNGIMIFNEGATDVYLGFGEDASTSAGAKIPASGSLIIHYQGVPDGYADLQKLQINGISSASAPVTYQEL